jgi:hypothetical protein
MEQPVLVIAVPRDGVAQGQNGKDHQAFERSWTLTRSRQRCVSTQRAYGG